MSYCFLIIKSSNPLFDLSKSINNNHTNKTFLNFFNIILFNTRDKSRLYKGWGIVLSSLFPDTKLRKDIA